jgi:S-DNA-T family DNA segregation ATPase FtsK/SpoIIIE
LVGGQVGRWIDQPLRSALGGGGAVVILAMILIGGLMLAFNLSLMELSADLAEFGDRASDHLRGWRLAREARRRARAAARAEQIELPLNMSAAGARPTGANPPGIVSRGPAEAPAQTPSVPAAPLPAPTAEAAHAPAVLRRSDPPPDADPLASPMAGPGHPWALPRVAEMLAESEETQLSLTDIREKTHTIEETLRSLGVPVTVVEVNPGPVVTQFGLEPGYVERRERDGKVKRAKVKVSRIAALSNDLALALAAAPIRIETPVPGKGIVGLEVPNLEKSTVGLRGVIESEQFRALKSRLAVGFGRDVSGEAVVDDLTDLPHLLIAGATGSGKSVCINALVACLLYHNTPDDLKMIMIDPKRVELSVYNGIPHLLAPVVVEMDRVVGVLNWVAGDGPALQGVCPRGCAATSRALTNARPPGETHALLVSLSMNWPT